MGPLSAGECSEARRRHGRVLGYEDARRLARRRLPRALWEFVDCGAEDEVALRRNVEAFRSLRLRPRLGVWCPSPVTKTSLFDTPISMPVVLAPCGGLRQLHPDGELGAARAAVASGTICAVSAASGHPLEEIAAVEGPKWFQLYRFWGRGGLEMLVHRAAAAGYEAIVATLDSPVSGYRERDLRYTFRIERVGPRSALRHAPQLLSRPRWAWRFARDGLPFELANTAPLGGDGAPLPLTAMSASGPESLSPTWEDLEWVREQWRGPLLVKGILTGEDTRRAVALGADGVIVSNHGGRQLDAAPATIEVLPEVVAAAGGDLVVLLDSGVRRGGDVLKALALGARAVLLGRPYVWGLAIGGSGGVYHMLELLREEIVRTMQLLGCSSVHELDPSSLLPAAPGERRGG